MLNLPGRASGLRNLCLRARGSREESHCTARESIERRRVPQVRCWNLGLGVDVPRNSGFPPYKKKKPRRNRGALLYKTNPTTAVTALSRPKLVCQPVSQLGVRTFRSDIAHVFSSRL